MERLSFLRADITLDPASRDVWSGASQKWLTLGFEFLAPPEESTAFIASTPTVDDATRSRKYSRANWDKALSDLGEHPFDTTLTVFGEEDDTLDEDETDSRLATLSVAHLHSSGNWVTFVADIATEKANLTDPAYCGRWVDFVTRSLYEVNPAFGVIMNDYRGMGETTLDLALRRPQRVSIREARTVLRGYGWVTICPPEVIERLGGIQRLDATHAFHRVEALADGGAVFQSTESYDRYDDVAARRVFEAFAPALPAGDPQPIVTAKEARLVFEDAHRRDR